LKKNIEIIRTSTRNNDSQTGLSVTSDVSNPKALIQQFADGDVQNQAAR